MLSPTGDQYEIRAAGYTATIVQSGAALRSLRYDDRDLVADFGADAVPRQGAGQVLAPWPNRIRDGRYAWEGASYQLALSEPERANASHGLVRWAAWSPIEHQQDRIRLGYRLMAQSGYPWTLDLEIEYALGPDGLGVTQRATNRTGAAAPYASGAHPYLVLDGPVDEWTLQVPASLAVESDDRMLPTGSVPVAGTDLDFRAGRRLATTALDTCFGDLERGPDGRAEVRVHRDGSGVRLWVDDHHPWLMLFTGEGGDLSRRALAVEPMTAPVDAFNSGTDLTRLGAGETVAVSWGIADLAGPA